MIVIHFYTGTYFPDGYDKVKLVKLLCTGEKVPHTYGEGSYKIQAAVTVPHNVTCPKCLTILIPTVRNRLNMMEDMLQIQLKEENESKL